MGLIRNKPSVRLAVWASSRRWARPVCWVLSRVYWPLWRAWDWHGKRRLEGIAWRARCLVCQLLRLGCPRHHQPRMGGVMCPRCVQERLLDEVRARSQ